MNLKYLLLGLALIFIVWVGYVAYAAYTLSPRVSAQWGYVNEKTTEIWVEAKLSKPLLVPASIEELRIEFTGIPVARVTRFEYGATETDVSFVLAIDNYNLVRSLVNYMNNGQSGTVAILLQGRLLGIIPIKTDIEQGISENVLAYLNFTAESKDLAGGLVKTPALVETRFDWAGEENGRARLIAHMKFHNPNAFPIPIGNVSFDVYANEIKIGDGRTARVVVIPANGYATLDVETYIEEDSLPKVWAEHIKSGEVSKVRADVFLDIRVMNQDYHVKLVSYEETVKTDIMGELNRLLEDMLR
ncbi:hypothetical protein CL1_1094 [Thermococcus cleftensis]|uniref:Water stress and hypersensitive response domain-containing protein n=1 Tax=Thermococcus cleftensis (strain DSM 27260 / KACC 17922 / CL1) TaxID=163003 RepID=I3ZUB3_THECF|nr:LEA type 2 family protein [Thermococcus cleftensis]AFL95297.1 hypothetical protein CL1_1094 [Thermococcus cleftensis]